MNSKLKNHLINFLEISAFALFGNFVGWIIGAFFLGNLLGGIRLLGLRGYESAGVVGALGGIVIGALFGSYVVVKTCSQKTGIKSSSIMITGLIIATIGTTLVIAGAPGEIRPKIKADTNWAEIGSWMQMGSIIEDAIYYNNIDVLFGLTPPASITRENAQLKLDEWRQYKYKLGGETGSLDENDYTTARINIQGLPEELTLKYIEGKWYLIL